MAVAAVMRLALTTAYAFPHTKHSLYPSCDWLNQCIEISCLRAQVLGCLITDLRSNLHRTCAISVDLEAQMQIASNSADISVIGRTI